MACGGNARLLDGFAVTEDGPTFDGTAIEVRFIEMRGEARSIWVI